MGMILEIHYCALSTAFNRAHLFYEIQAENPDAKKIADLLTDSFRLLELLHQFSFPLDEFRDQISDELGGLGWLRAERFTLHSALLSIAHCWDKGYGKEDSRFKDARVRGRAFLNGTSLSIPKEAAGDFRFLNEFD
jgi:hypothetical protein